MADVPWLHGVLVVCAPRLGAPHQVWRRVEKRLRAEALLGDGAFARILVDEPIAVGDHAEAEEPEIPVCAAGMAPCVRLWLWMTASARSPCVARGGVRRAVANSRAICSGGVPSPCQSPTGAASPVWRM